MKQGINNLKVGVILSYISRFIQISVGLIYTPIMIRLLGQSQYGLYNIAASTIAYLGVLNFGFGSAYMRFYSRYKVKKDEKNIAVLNGMFLLIFSIIGLVVVIAGIIIAFNVDIIFGPSLSSYELTTSRILILILVINLAFSFPVIVFNTFLQANEKFIFKNIILIIRQVTTPLVNLPILLAGYGSVGMVTGTVFVNLVIEIIIVYYSINKMKMRFSFKNFDYDLMKEMSVYSSYIFINMIVDQINSNMDKTILARYQGTISVAIYSVGSTINAYYGQLSTTISSILTPKIHRIVASNGSDIELTKFFTRIGRIQFIILSAVLTGFIFFGRPFISIWAGEEYFNSYIIAMLLMITFTVDLIQNTSIEIQRAKNMHKVRSWVFVFIALSNIIISIPMAIQYGEIGVTLGTAISFLIGNGLFMNIYNHKVVGLNIIYFWKEICKFYPAFILPILYALVINRMIDLYNFRNLVVFGLLYLILFIISMWKLGLNSYEKHLLKNPIKSI